MTPATRQATTRHIVITLDASGSVTPALDNAVRLAAILGAHLEGVFVEDINLIRLAELPFLREVRPWSLAEETVSSQRMLSELRTLARHAERMLEQAARTMGVPWSFQVWRGSTGAETLAQAFDADILSLCRMSSRASSRMWAATGRSPRPAKLADAPITVLLSDSERAVRALTTACQLAKDLGIRVTVLLPHNQTTDSSKLKAKARSILEAHGQTANFIQLAGTGIQSLLQATYGYGFCTLITEIEHPLLQQGGLDQCLEALAYPVLLVR